MKGKEIKKMVQNKLLTENEDLFFIGQHTSIFKGE